MREILFRGKRVDSGEWKYGHYSSVYGAAPVIFEDVTLEDDCTISFEYDHVDNTTVGQYTGLTDRNGVKICEGDVMVFDAYGFHYKGVVSFVDGNFCVMCNRPTASPFLDGAIKQHDAICVGNIHDNPELMEGD